MYEGYETLLVEKADHIVTVTMNRPELLNATDMYMHQELERVFLEIGADADAHVVVITGAGRAFSAGGDLAKMLQQIDDQARWADSMGEARRILANLLMLDQPVIAKINGHAMGLGSTLALFCDITIASEKAKIADTHVAVGLVAGDGGAIIWPLLAGHARAKMKLLLGEVISAGEAAEWGLITECVPANELDARVADVAGRLAGGAQVAIRGTKRALTMMVKDHFDRQIDAHLGLETLSHLSHDHREAVTAFVEKRAPEFTGR